MSPEWIVFENNPTPEWREEEHMDYIWSHIIDLFELMRHEIQGELVTEWRGNHDKLIYKVNICTLCAHVN
jgi:hypothetical protein